MKSGQSCTPGSLNYAQFWTTIAGDLHFKGALNQWQQKAPLIYKFTQSADEIRSPGSQAQ